MKLQVLADASAVAQSAAKLIAAEARAVVKARGRFVMALSGGQTPRQMLRDFAEEDVPWKNVHILQVDERIAPAGDPDRNLTQLWESLILRAPVQPDQVHVMPVEEKNLEAAAADYSRILQKLAGHRPCWIWFIWGLASMVIQPRSSRTTRSLMLRIRTSP
jgi:6-phosphogluconolactonase/glucosamine-6-phosphate isomerase/deaminase